MPKPGWQGSSQVSTAKSNTSSHAVTRYTKKKRIYRPLGDKRHNVCFRLNLREHSANTGMTMTITIELPALVYSRLDNVIARFGDRIKVTRSFLWLIALRPSLLTPTRRPQLLTNRAYATLTHNCVQTNRLWPPIVPDPGRGLPVTFFFLVLMRVIIQYLNRWGVRLSWRRVRVCNKNVKYKYLTSNRRSAKFLMP